MSPNREKHNQVSAKARAINEAVAHQNQIAWDRHLGNDKHSIVPIAIDDKEISSRMYGPQTRSLQWIGE